MARPTTPVPLTQLRNPSATIQDQISALKDIKNEIIGHDQRKEAYIRQGVVQYLVRILNHGIRRREADKSRAREHDGHWSHEEEARLQCCYVVASLARGGLPYATPLVAGGVLTPLLADLSPSELHSRIILESLRTVKVIAESLWTDIRVEDSTYAASFAEQLYSKPVLTDFVAILSQREDSPAVREQLTLLFQIIECTLKQRNSQHQNTLVKMGIMDQLAARLAALVQTSVETFSAETAAQLPPSPSPSSLRYLLNALTAIVRGSLYRKIRLLDAKHLQATNVSHQQKIDQYLSSDLSYPSPTSANPVDTLLPQLQAVQPKSDAGFSRAFPALGAFKPGSDHPRLPNLHETTHIATSRTISVMDFGSSTLTWLVHLARTKDQNDRLAAVWLLVNLIHEPAGSVVGSWRDHGNRNRALAFLIVPLIVKMLEEAVPRSSSRASREIDPEYRKAINVLAPRALGLIVDQQKDLQRAAVDAGAIKLLCQILKKSFDPMTTTNNAMWSPHPAISHPNDMMNDDPASTLGPPTLSPEHMHRFEVRAATLGALSLIGQKEDAHRKEIINNGIVQCVVDCLTPWPDGPVDVATGRTPSEVEGNPPFVIIEACRTVTALSRSVSVLRTSLIDGGVAKPAFALLSHPDVSIKLVATDVITNLVVHLSPMREELITAGVLPILCDHAHSDNTELVIGSLWALKNMLNSLPNEIKIQAVERLGVDWLIQTLAGDILSLADMQRPTMASANAAGQQINLLNMDEAEEDAEDDSDDNSSGDDFMMSDSMPVRPAQYQMSEGKTRKARLKAIHLTETNTTLRDRHNEISRQEQALDFIRNLIGEPAPGQADMVDFLLKQFQSAGLLDILSSKLKARHAFASQAGLSQSRLSTFSTFSSPPKHLTASTANFQPVDRTSPSTRFAPPEILISTLFTLIHIANGRPQHRQLLIAHSTLLSNVLPMFTHSDNRVRVACCWLIHNLTWQEDANDAAGARSRALELRNRGIEDAVKRLVTDKDLDTNQRARSVMDVFARLLDSREGVGAARSSGSARVWES